MDGKGGKRRKVYLRDDTHAAVMAYVNAKELAGLLTEGALFLAHDNCSRGHRLSRRGVNKIVDRHLNAIHAKRPGVSCHSLRHTAATLAVASGAKVEHVKEMLGHSKLETTSIYVRAVERAKHNPANLIGVRV